MEPQLQRRIDRQTSVKQKSVVTNEQQDWSRCSSGERQEQAAQCFCTWALMEDSFYIISVFSRSMCHATGLKQEMDLYLTGSRGGSHFKRVSQYVDVTWADKKRNPYRAQTNKETTQKAKRKFWFFYFSVCSAVRQTESGGELILDLETGRGAVV